MFKYSLPRVIFIIIRTFLLHSFFQIVLPISYTSRFDFVRYAKKLAYKFEFPHWMTRVNRSVIVLHFNCFTFQTYWILFSFALFCFFVSFLGVGWLRFLFFLQRDRYRYSNTVHDIVSTMEINQPSGLFIIGGVIETHFILFYSFARKTKKYIAKNAKKSTQINEMKSWNQCKQYTHNSWITLFDHSSDSIF